MSKEVIEKEIAEIIKNFRKSSVGIEINQKHVNMWVSQFEPNTQNIILEETLHILKEWYFDKDKIYLFLDDVIDYLKEQNEDASKVDPFNGICFLDIQESGKSQSQLVEMLKNKIYKEYGSNISIGNPGQNKYYVYLDDGLYTGSRLRKDIKGCLENMPKGTRIDIILLITCSSGLNFSKNKLEKICSDRNIKINIYRWREICNNKTFTRIENGFSYEINQECLWPSSKLSVLPEINSYFDKLTKIKGGKVHYCFRNAEYNYTEGVFSSLENRDIVEEEFLKKGIMIMENIREHKGLYPLGYNITPSFGFGSFCATELNISNTCPIVLWWGNVIKKGDELDCWYPLLPRRISDKDINPFDADWALEESEDDGYDYIFGICPDCGCGISLRNDGGNGFCNDCKWNH
jgi:putative uncharacterized protein (fragment)